MQTAATDFPYSAPRIEIAATFTASPLEAPLRFWLGELSLPYQLNFAPYQQLFQSLLDPAGGFAANQKGANVVLFRLEDLTADDAPLSFLEQHSAELRAAVRSAAGRSSAPFLVCLCPASARFLKSAEHAAFAAKEQDLWHRDLAGAAHVFSISAEEAIKRYQVEDVGDEHADRMGHIPYHAPFFVALATQILRAVLAFDRKPVKVIALDCDNTLWSGVCGEDGPKGVVVDAGRLAFQRFLLRQRDAGILLVLASKNNEADVRETFDTHPEMLLRWNDIVAHRVNWDAKSQNLLELASELNLGLDSIVFFDDDAKECAEVSEELPEVLTFQIPHDPDQLPRFLDHLWVFDRVRPLTSEDRERPKLYAEQTQRNRFEKQAADLKEFLAGLQLEVVFEPVNDATLARVAQLTQRTNQMNTTLRRYTQGELAAALVSGDIQAFTVTVSDRFGSYGLVGAVLFHLSAGTLDIDGFLLSCRALGRGVEHRMLRQAAAIASQEGKRAVRISLVEGPRNRPALDFIHSLSPSSADGHPMEFPVEALAHLELLTGSVARPVSSSPAEKQTIRKEQDSQGESGWRQIAESLQTAAQIEARMRASAAPSPLRHRTVSSPPETDLQRRLAAIWCQLLHLDEVGIDEDFFDLGGHSLLAVQLLSQIQRDLDVDLPDAVIYGEKVRIDTLARTIELQQLGVADQTAYDSLLAEIESLSDEEVAALLAEEESSRDAV